MPSGRCPYCKRHTIFSTAADVPPMPGRPNRQGLKGGSLVLDRCSHQDCLALVYREVDPKNHEIQWDIYPPVEMTVDEELPESVKRSFQEALNTFLDGHWNSSAQATGRALTDAMMELKPEETKTENWAEKGLKKQIDILVQQRVLPPVIGEWAQEVRAVRVLSEHGDKGKAWWGSEQDATEALELAKWIFRYLFVLPKQIENRRNRLKRSSESSPAS